MDWVGPTAACPRCSRIVELDEHGRMGDHWDLNTFVTDECPGAREFNGSWAGRQHHHGSGEPPWWAVAMELRILERLDGVLAERAAMERVVIATRRAQEALAKLSPVADEQD